MEVTGVMATDAGMFGLWSPASFVDIVDYDTWESELLEDDDIKRHITAGAFVPVNIGSDGAFQVFARVGSASTTASLTQRERQYALVSSKPYLFITPVIDRRRAPAGPPRLRRRSPRPGCGCRRRAW
jgi:hypothetical protein